MWFDSTEGEGSTFYFTISVPRKATSPHMERIPFFCEDKRLLIVDSCKAVVDLLSSRLSLMGNYFILIGKF